MKKQAPAEESGGEKAPLWIISFADMVSLLMAFFVMLQTLAQTKSGKVGYVGEGVFAATLEGFRKNIAGYGMPSVFGGSSNKAFNFDREATYYPIEGGDSNAAGNIADGREEKVRRIFSRVCTHAQSLSSQIRGRSPNFVVTPIEFKAGQAALDESAKRFLDKFATDLQHTVNMRELTIYVVGLAWDEKSEEEQWKVSAKRAEIVAEFLQDKLPAEVSKSVFSWGAGAGGEWVKGEHAVSERSNVLIAVLKTRD
jgi:flagellar motor protein MotB